MDRSTGQLLLVSVRDLALGQRFLSCGFLAVVNPPLFRVGCGGRGIRCLDGQARPLAELLCVIAVFLFDPSLLSGDVLFFQFNDVPFRALLGDHGLGFGAVAEGPDIGVGGDGDHATRFLLTDDSYGGASR